MPSGIGISSGSPPPPAPAPPPASLRLDLLEDDIRQRALLAGFGRGERGERLLVLRRQLHVLVVRTARVVRRTRRERLIEFLRSEDARAPRRGDRVVLVVIVHVGILLVDGGHERPAKRRGRRWALAVVVARLHLLQLLPRLQQNLVGHGVGHERILGLPLALFRAALPLRQRVVRDLIRKGDVLLLLAGFALVRHGDRPLRWVSAGGGTRRGRAEPARTRVPPPRNASAESGAREPPLCENRLFV